MDDVGTATSSVVEKPQILINENGYLEATTIEGKYRIAKMLFDSKMVPKSYENPQQVLIGMQFAIELGLSPFIGLRNIAVINGNPSIWGDLPLALARKTGQLEYINEFLIDKDYVKICFANKNLNNPAWAGVCLLKRKGEFETEAIFSMDDAKTAGLLNRRSVTPWETYPKIMMQRRARASALKLAFADALSSIGIAEYDHNYIPAKPERVEVNFEGEQVFPEAAPANKLNQTFRAPGIV